ncbi:hypothetical protein MXB_2508 [Myxobolus squamalis]|nr:hypothetical protein MXB_2508 [Myxobolus squamalis]
MKPESDINAHKFFKVVNHENLGAAKSRIPPAQKKSTPFSSRKHLSEVQASSLGDSMMAPAGLTPRSSHSPTKAEVSESERIRRMLCSDDVNEDYWKEVAEQRRLALIEVSEENKHLSQEQEILQEQIRELQREISSLVEYKLLYKIFCLNDSKSSNHPL